MKNAFQAQTTSYLQRLYYCSGKFWGVFDGRNERVLYMETQPRRWIAGGMSTQFQFQLRLEHTKAIGKWQNVQFAMVVSRVVDDQNQLCSVSALTEIILNTLYRKQNQKRRRLCKKKSNLG